MTERQLHQAIITKTGKQHHELSLLELFDAMCGIQFELENHYMDYEESYDGEYDYHDSEFEEDYALNQQFCEAYDLLDAFVTWKSRIKDDELFSIQCWPIEHENEAFREIWKRRLSEEPIA